MFHVKGLIWIGTAVAGAFISLIVRRVFDKPFDRWERKTINAIRSGGYRLKKLKNESSSQDEFRIGKWKAAWVAVEGSSSDPYSPSNIVCKLDPVPVELPPDRQQKKNRIEKDQAEREREGRPEFHDGPIVALEGFARGQTGATEEPFLALRFRQFSYYSYLATTQSLDEEIETPSGQKVTVREKYLRNLDYKNPNPQFSGAFSVNLSFMTKDGYIVVARRGSTGVSSYAGCLSPAVNECVNPQLDRIGSDLSLFATAQRGARHELNVDIREDELKFFTLGVDTHFNSYLLTGLIRSKTYTRADLIARRSHGSKERWETENLIFLQSNLQSVARTMNELDKTEKWTSVSIVCLAQTLISEFGTKKVERALSR